MSDREQRREWLASLVGAFLLVVLGAVVAGWTLPMLLWDEASPWAAGAIGGFWVLVLLVCVVMGRAAADGDRRARQAFAERRRGDGDWCWPGREGRPDR